MPEGVDGTTLRQWRLSREWSVRRMARELINAADEPVATLGGLMHMINAWERDARPPSDLYMLLYLRVFRPHVNGTGPHPEPGGVLEQARRVPGGAELAALQVRALRSGDARMVTLADTLMSLQRQVTDLAGRLEELLAGDDDDE